MGRLEDIIERNRHPRRAVRKRKGLGVGLASIVLFGALVMLIFTNLAQPPEDPQPPPPPSGEHRIRDVKLGTVRPKAGSGSAVGSGSAAPRSDRPMNS